MALYRRGNVWWMDVYQGAARKRIRKSTGVTDKTQARLIEQAAIAVNRGISTRERAMQVIDAVLPIEEHALKLADARAFYEDCIDSEGIRLGKTTREHRLNIIGIFAEWARDNTRCETVEQVDSHIVFAFTKMLNERRCNKNGVKVPISVATKNAYIGDLITAWKMFVKRSKAKDNPWTVARYQRARDEETHGRPFTDDEIVRLCAVAREVGFGWEPMIYIGLYTGLRLGDASNLRWRDVDLDRCVIEMEPSKTARHGTRVTIPIHRRLESVLKALPRDGEFVLPDRCGKIRGRLYPEGDCPFNEIIRRAGLVAGENDKLSYHCFRTTFVTRLAEAGVPQDVRMKLSGHASAQVHEIYDRQTSSLAAAIERLK